MDKETLQKMAVSAYANLAKAKADLFTATEEMIIAEQALDDAKTAAQIGGKIDGKNEEIRKAQLRDLLKAETFAVASKAKIQRAVMHGYENARIDVETVNILLRVAELPQ